MPKQDVESTEEKIARWTFKQMLFTTIITAILASVTSIFVALISTGYFDPNKKDQLGCDTICPPDSTSIPKTTSEQTTIVHTTPSQAPFWVEAQGHFIWFNAQYRNATNRHDDIHFINMDEKKVPYTLILIQPDRANKSDFKNFEEKFKDMRRFVQIIRDRCKKKEYNVDTKLPEMIPHVCIFRERTTPSISFFLTQDARGIKKVIFYLEEKHFTEDRKPDLCFETSDKIAIEAFEARYKDFEKERHNSLNLNSLLSEEPDSTFFLKE